MRKERGNRRSQILKKSRGENKELVEGDAEEKDI